MLPITDAFEFDYFGSDLVFGRGCVDGLDETLSDRNLDDALVVCGRNVGANEDLMEPIRHGLGDRLAGVFDETRPEKSAETVYDGIEAMREANADVLVGVGGGSSLDIARQIGVFAADGRSLSEFRELAREDRLEPPEPSEPPTPVVVIPTTLAGADISDTGSMAILPAEESPTGETMRTNGSNFPVGMFYDPELFETTPREPMAGSAMNGFDKPLETIYARNSNPITHATAVHSLRLLREGLPGLPDDDPDAVDRAVVGMILAQFERRLSIIHAFGHGVSRQYPVHQGLVHAVIAPHALRYVMGQVDARRELLASGLGVDPTLPDDELADAVVEEVIRVRDAFDLPTRLRDIDPVEEDDLPLIARYTIRDGKMEQVPAGLDPTVEDLEAVLRAAW